MRPSKLFKFFKLTQKPLRFNNTFRAYFIPIQLKTSANLFNCFWVENNKVAFCYLIILAQYLRYFMVSPSPFCQW